MRLLNLDTRNDEANYARMIESRTFFTRGVHFDHVRWLMLSGGSGYDRAAMDRSRANSEFGLDDGCVVCEGTDGQQEAPLPAAAERQTRASIAVSAESRLAGG